jgi:hypothetical protein
MSLNMKNCVFWDITPYSPLKVNRRLGGKCRLYLHLHGEDMFLRNVGWFSTDHTALYPGRQSSS